MLKQLIVDRYMGRYAARVQQAAAARSPRATTRSFPTEPDVSLTPSNLFLG